MAGRSGALADETRRMGCGEVGRRGFASVLSTERAAAGDGPTLALLVDHDDAEREFSYVSKAETFSEAEPITDVGARLGWTVISMAAAWETVFAG